MFAQNETESQDHIAYKAIYKSWIDSLQDYGNSTVIILNYSDANIVTSTHNTFPLVSTLFHYPRFDSTYMFSKMNENPTSVFMIPKTRLIPEQKMHLQVDSLIENETSFITYFKFKKTNYTQTYYFDKTTEFLGLHHYQKFNNTPIPLPYKYTIQTTQPNKPDWTIEMRLIDLELIDNNQRDILKDYKTPPEMTPALKARMVSRFIKLEHLKEFYQE